MPADIRNLVSLQNRRRQAARSCRLQVDPLDPEASAEWIYDDDTVRHRSGAFFRIVGLRHRDRQHADRTVIQPIVDQPEVGLLGMAVRSPGAAADVLVQWKCEPGTVESVQLGPACQATQSNLSRVHGGARPPGAWLCEPSNRILADSLQSEHGMRFWHKRNRNLLVMLSACTAIPAADVRHLSWIPLSIVRQALAIDFLVNTDTRSVLATMCWQQVMGEQPFAAARSAGVLESMVDESWRAQPAAEADEAAAMVIAWLEQLRTLALDDAVLVPLADVQGLQRSPDGLAWRAATASFDVRHVSVSIRGRERERWDQPLIQSRGPGDATLLAFRRHGIWRFIFRAVSEPGLAQRVELHPGMCCAPGLATSPESSGLSSLAQTGTVVREVRQSDEGGRFWQDVTTFRVVAMADPGQMPDGCLALSLREIGCLAPRGVFTNEARSAISLLLSTS